MHLAGPGGGFDLVGAVDEIAGARLHAEPVERRLSERVGKALAEVGGNLDVIGLEGAGEGAFQLPLGVSGIELRP